jgi:lipoate---protein ligase
MSIEWRVIALEEHDAYKNMAIDESILDHVKINVSRPTMRFYRWNPSAVSIGRFQSMRDEVNIQKCKELGITPVRRITGGGAVYHDYSGELTYSIIAPQSEFPSGIRESYALICGWVIGGLKNVGIDAAFAPINDITSNGKKISGCAQTRRNGVLLQHGTILYNLDVSRMFSVLTVSNEKISDKMIKRVEDRVTSVSAQKSIQFEELYQGIVKGLTDGKEYKMGTLSESEMNRAEILKGTYSSDAWNFSR